MATNALSLELETGFDPIHYARHTASSYVRKNYEMAQAVYRADAIRRVAGIRAARTFLSCIGAEAQLIDRVMSSSPRERRR